MKKLSVIVFIFGSAMFISNQVKAQHFYTSFGVGVSWNIPAYVNYTVHDNYFGYQIAHVKRFNRYGYTNYNVLLHRNGQFVEVRMDNHGHIYRTINHRWSYPLMSHNCGSHCAFHQTYYRTHYPRHQHHTTKIVYVDTHHGHGKVHQQNKYYTNVYVQKQQKPQQHRESNTAIRQPTKTSTSVARSQVVKSNSRSSSMDSQQVSANSRTSNVRSSSGNVVIYKNQRGASR